MENTWQELVCQLLEDGDSRVRRAAVSALGDSGDPRAIEPLSAMLQDRRSEVRKAAVEALAGFGETASQALIAALRDEDQNVRWSAARALGKSCDAQLLGPLIEALGYQSWSDRDAIAEILSGFGEAAGQPLIAALASENPGVREISARALGKLRDAQAVEPLSALLMDGDREVRWAAAGALGELRDERAIEPLCKALERGDHHERTTLLSALEYFVDARMIEPLITVLREEDDGLRETAVEMLVRLGEPAAQPLIVVVQEEDPDLRRVAVGALGQLGSLTAVEPLIAVLQDEHPDLRRAAAEALDALGWEPEDDAVGARYWVAEREWEQCRRLGSHAVDPLIAALGDEDRQVRRMAATTLGQLCDARAVEPLGALLQRESDEYARLDVVKALAYCIWEDAIPGLILALQDSYPLVRSAALEELAWLGEPAVESLISELQSENDHVRSAVVEALGELSAAQAVEPLIELLEKEDLDLVRSAIASTLGQLGDPAAVQPLIARLENDRHNSVREAAARALEQLGDPEAVVPLITALKHDSRRVRQAAAEGLDSLITAGAAEPLLAASRDDEQNGRRAAALVPEPLGDERVTGSLIAALRYGEEDVQYTVLRTLDLLGDERALDLLVTALQDGERNVRKGAARTLDRLITARVVAPLTAEVKEWHQTVVKGAARSLGLLEDERFVDLLTTAYPDDRSDVRKAAAEGLNQLLTTRAGGPLIAALKDEEEGVRKSVAHTLGLLGAERAVDPLIAALQDDNSDVRKAAAEGLDLLITTRVVDPLIAALKYEEDVRKIVARTQRLLGDERGVDRRITTLQEDISDVRKAAAEGLHQVITARAVGPLIATLKDKEEDLRKTIAHTLGLLGDERAVAPLIAALENGDDAVREAVAHALGRLGDAGAFEPLVDLLSDEASWVRWAAARALGRLGDMGAVEPLIGALQDRDGDVRQAAAHALGRLGSMRAIEPLTRALQDGNTGVRRASADARRRIVRTYAAIAHLDGGKLLAFVQSQVSEGVDAGKLDRAPELAEPEAVEPLNDGQVAGLLIAALAGTPLSVREAAEQALIDLGAPAVQPLVAALENGDSEAREAAVRALGALGNGQAVEPLIATLGDPEGSVQRAAAQALAQLGDGQAVEPLIAMLREPDDRVGQAAARALGQLGDGRAIEPLIALLQDTDSHLAQDAAEALRRLINTRSLGPFIWSALTLEVASSAWKEVGDILTGFAGTRAIDGTADRAGQLAGLVGAIADRAIKDEAFDDLLAAFDQTLDYFRVKVGAMSADDDSTMLLEGAGFCFDLGERTVRTLTSVGLNHAIKKTIDQLMDLTRSLGNVSTAWQGLKRLGQVLVDVHEETLAFEVRRQSVSLIARAWFMQPVEEAGLRSFFADKAQIYDGLALDYLRLGAATDAWETLEASKTRYLGDLIARRQRTPQRTLGQVRENFWATVRRVRETAWGRDLDAPPGTRELTGVEPARDAPGTLVAEPVHQHALEQYEGERSPTERANDLYLEPMQGFIGSLWKMAGRLPGHPLEARVREELRPAHELTSGLLGALRGEPGAPSSDTLQDQFEEVLSRLKELNGFEEALSRLEEFDGLDLDGEQSLRLWIFWEVGKSPLQYMISGQFVGPAAILGLEALLEVLNLITGEGRVYVTVRPRTPEDGDAPAPIFRTRAPEGSGTARQRLDQAHAEITTAWERLSRTRWAYVLRLARGDTISFADMRLALAQQTDTALVQFHVTDQGTRAYLSRGGPPVEGETPPTGIRRLLARLGLAGNRPNPNGPAEYRDTADSALKILTLPDFTLEHLNNLMHAGWVEPYRNRANGQGDWLDAIERTLGQVYDELLRPVDEQLREWQIKHVILVPHRALHLLPLHAGWHEKRGQRRYLLDDYQISYTPSSTLAQICRQRAETRRRRDTLTAISNPTYDLAFAAAEVEEVKSFFPESGVHVLRGEQARLEAVTASAPGALAFLHFSCHGRYDWDSPLDSRLQLAGHSPLLLGDLFDEQIPLPETVLVVLSACETNITDPEDLADEYLGLASGFLFAGTPTVVSTLWAVEDLSTALLMGRFYHNHLQKSLRPSQALGDAQEWLRTEVDRPYVLRYIESVLSGLATQRRQVAMWSEEQAAIDRQISQLKGKLRYVQEQERRDPDGRPFAHPFYWAAFTVSGVDLELDHIDNEPVT